ncbi:PepSY domain-containing protein [Nesterenkonia alba]|uniref:PepSY domain-containing protein n=1 Tax=Nesterenkonia alba TaxID=515814 RepID=UPI0003B3C813|nr:PepSY domain-containing protein [Nesterenkonia alba]
MDNTSRSTTAGLISVATAAALALAACGSDDTTEDTTEPAPQDTTEAPEPTEAEEEESPGVAEPDETEDAEATDQTPDAEEATSDQQAGDQPVYQALATVQEEYPDGVIIDFDTEGNHIEFSVFDGNTEWEVDVDAETFEIIDTRQEGLDADDEQEALAVETDFGEALATAEAEGGAEPQEGDLDTEDGVVVWQIELSNDTEVSVDVATGEVVRVDT